MFFDPLSEEVIDYVGGRNDLEAPVFAASGILRARFEEDKLRLMRGIRMATRFDLAIEPETMAAIKEMCRASRS